MANISRRKFIKSIGLCTILTATGNIHDGLSFVPSHLNIQNEKQRLSSVPNGFTHPENTDRNLFIGVGNPGLKISNALQTRTNAIGAFTDESISIQQFSPNNNQINGFISEAQIIFLIGSMKDKDFWIARELILSHNIFLLYTIVIEDKNPLLSAHSFPVNEKEGCIFISEKHYEQQAVLTIHSLFSMLMVPGLVGIDGNDIKSTVGGKSGFMVHTVSSYVNSFSAFKQTIWTYKTLIKSSSSLLLHIMYDEKIDCTMDDLTNISDTLHYGCSSDTEVLWACTDALKIGVDFRATLFISVNQTKKTIRRY